MVTRERLENEVKSIVDQLVQRYKPEKIILFGSLARDTGIPYDIDLFIVKKDVPHRGVDRIRELDRLIKYRLATDFIVYKPEEVEERLRLGDPFVAQILREGKVLYNAQ